MEKANNIEGIMVGDFVCPKLDCVTTDDETHEDLYGVVTELYYENNTLAIQSIGRNHETIIGARKVIKTEIPPIFKKLGYNNKFSRKRTRLK